MKTKTTFIAMLFALSLITTTPAASQNYSPRTLEEAINNPEIKDSKLKSDIIVQQNHIAKSIYENNHNLIVSPTRNEEVILVRIPADQLFAPNETEMMDGAAERILEKFTPLMSRPDYYRIALAMYHDDNGGDTYSEQITQQRLQSVVNWFMANTNNGKYISYFAMGNKNPIFPMNDSMQHRRLNRRLEIYIIPGEAMIQQSKNDKKNKKNKKNK